MSAQIIVLGTRAPDSDEAYMAYASAAGALFKAAGAIPAAKYGKIGQVAGESGPQEVIVVDFPDEDSVYRLFDSPEYRAIAPHRDAAYEKIDVIVTSAG